MTWPFTLSDLTAGLRRHFGDTGARVVDLTESPLAAWPSVGTVRAASVTADTRGGARRMELVVKEPRGATRTGLAGVGRREAGVYQSLRGILPVSTPALIAADPDGGWLILEAVPAGRAPNEWTAETYRNAIVQLACLHERFWNLAEDLTYYPWLARPLTADFEIHVFAAAKAMEAIVTDDRLANLTGSAESLHALGVLIGEAERVAAPLRDAPQTLIHGDYWPGNMMPNAEAEGGFTLVDWQLAAIAPGVLDLVVMIKNSQWWFAPLPMSEDELIRIYRAELRERLGHEWPEAEWALLWDHAVMWRFMQEWIDLLAAMPAALLGARADLLGPVWLDPVKAAVGRRLGG